MQNNKELFANQFPFKSRPLTAEDLAETEPFFWPGKGDKADHGILLLHGFNSTPATLRAMGHALAAEGYTVSCPCLPGHDTTLADLNKTQWPQWLEAVQEAYRMLGQHCAKLSLIGFSLGGTLALQLAAVNLSLHRLFLLAPAVYPIAALRLLRVIGRPLEMLGINYLPRAADLKNPQAIEIGYAKTPIRAALEVYKCMRATQKILGQVKVSTVVFHARQDHVVPPNRTPELIARLGVAKPELIWLENSYHVIPRDYDAELVTRTIIERLKVS